MNEKIYSLSEAIKLLGISQRQAEQLDELDGKKDEQITKSIFDMALQVQQSYNNYMPINNNLFNKVKEIINPKSGIKIPTTMSNDTFNEIEFKKDIDDYIKNRIKFLISHKDLVIQCAKEQNENGPLHKQCMNIAYKGNTYYPEKFLPDNMEDFNDEINRLQSNEIFIFIQNLPKNIKEKYGDNLGELVSTWNNKFLYGDK